MYLGLRPLSDLKIGLCDVDFSILNLITILTQTDMLYGDTCILCEFETYFQRKPIRPFPKSLNMSLEQTYAKIHIYEELFSKTL